MARVPATCNSSSKRKDRWTWNEEKTDAFLFAVKNYKRQKLGEGFEWDSDKVVLLEYVRKKLGERWPAEFGRSEAPIPDKPFQDMTKEEYKEFTEVATRVKEVISVGYRRVYNKYKTLKRTYIKDCKDGLRSGSGQLTKKYWHECHELWGGSASTEPLNFGIESSSEDICTSAAVDTNMELSKEISENNEHGLAGSENSQLSIDTDNNSVCDVNSDWSASISPVPCSSHSEDEKVVDTKRKKTKQTTKTLIDNKRVKLQKRMTQEGKQDIMLQHSQRQLDLQETIVKELSKKDDGLESAMKSMAESAALLNRTLAQGMQFMFQGFQQPGPPVSQPQFMVPQFAPRPAQFQVNEMPVFQAPQRQPFTREVNHVDSTDFNFINYDTQSD